MLDDVDLYPASSIIRFSQLSTFLMIRDNPAFDKQVRRIYEPRYGRRLTDQEVYEIRTNLMAFAEGILEVAEKLYGRKNASPPAKRERSL